MDLGEQSTKKVKQQTASERRRHHGKPTVLDESSSRGNRRFAAYTWRREHHAPESLATNRGRDGPHDERLRLGSAMGASINLAGGGCRAVGTGYRRLSEGRSACHQGRLARAPQGRSLGG